MAAAVGIGHNGGPLLDFARPKFWLPTFEPWRLLKPLLMEGQWFPKQKVQFSGDVQPVVVGPIFPTIVSTSFGRTFVDNANYTANLPASLVSGNLLIMSIAINAAAARTFTVPSGWTAAINITVSGNLRRNIILTKTSNGAEGASVALTASGSSGWAHCAYQISGWSNVQVSTSAAGNNAAPDSNSLSPTGGSKKYLWIATANYLMSGGASPTPPANYGSMIGALPSTTASFCASRNLETATENPGVWAITPANPWAANTIAVHPV